MFCRLTFYRESGTDMKLLFLFTLVSADSIGSHVDVEYYEQALHAKLFGGKDRYSYYMVISRNSVMISIKAEIWNGSASVLHEFEETYNKKAHPIDIGKARWYKDSNWSDYKKFW